MLCARHDPWFHNASSDDATLLVINSEVFLFAPNGSWDYADDEWPEKRVSLTVRDGLIYNVVVISYGPFPDVFTLKTDLR